MHKNLLVTLLLSAAAVMTAADDLTAQMLQLNNSSARVTNNLWQRLQAGFQLQTRETPEVKYWEQRYARQKYFNIIMQNALPYLYFVVTEMERRGIPSELALIPIVESTYNPNAISPAAVSTGMWQFLASSGKRFGLAQNPQLDERKDIIKSTRAAITYLQYLHDMFGSWELAIAAYNWGEGNINNALNHSSSKDFYALDLRDTTRQYLPKVLALANIIKNPAKFGIKLSSLENSPYFAITQPQSPISLSDFSNLASLATLDNRQLNPQYNTLNYLLQTNQRVLLPLTKQPRYLASLPALTPVIPAVEEQLVNAESPDEIMLLAAQESNVTLPAENSASLNSAAPPRSNFSSYSVITGDTLYSIAKKFAMPLAIIRDDNQLHDNELKLQQQLLIRQPN